MSLLLLLSLLTAQPARADCAFRQDCIPTGADVCRPRPVGPDETLPCALPGQPFYACPQFQGSTCCTAQQNRLLYVNLLQIQALFGDERDGGCPGCYFNMHNFWCEYTCFPRQADFVSVLGAANVTDPENPGRLVEVLRTEVRLARDFGCDLYSSCQSVKSVTETSAMSNAEGFFAYQGQYEAIQHGAFIEFDLNPAQGNASCNRSSNGGGPCQGAMFIAPYSCCSFPADLNNNASGNSSCPCAYCKGMCPGQSCPTGNGGGSVASSLGDVALPWYNGFDFTLVGSVWAGLAVAVGVSFVVLPRANDAR